MDMIPKRTESEISISKILKANIDGCKGHRKNGQIRHDLSLILTVVVVKKNFFGEVIVFRWLQLIEMKTQVS